MDRFFLWTEVAFVIVLIWFSVFWWFEKIPSVDSIKKGLGVLDTKGGNLAILTAFSFIGIFASIRLMYYILQLSVDGKLQQDNSFALLTVQFMTNTITGGFIGALLKTMSGDTNIGQNLVSGTQEVKITTNEGATQNDVSKETR